MSEFWQFLKVLLVMFGLVVPFALLFYLYITPPFERILSRILPWWAKTILAAFGQGGLLALMTFGAFGIVFTSGARLIQAHPVVFCSVWGLLTIFFAYMNFSTGEYK